MSKVAKFEDVKSQWMKEEEFKQAYDHLELEYEISLQLIQARLIADLTQAELAKRMGTTQSVIARLESGKSLPSLRTLSQYAKAAGKHLHLSLQN